MDEQLDSELFEALELLENWDVLESEGDWEIYLAIDNTPVKEPPKPKPKPKAAGDEKA